jgi:1-acyl-sn-glycerol-3-phosphate acyltransferase
MLRTVLWYIFFWSYLFGSLTFFIPLIILFIFWQKRLLEKYVFFLFSTWGRNIVRVAGGKVTVAGLENIPQKNTICFIANHQGGFDIPLIFGYIPKTVGFIAKKELLYIPVFNVWMKVIHCIFINRSKRRDSVKVIQQGVEQIKQGFPMVIFPEGTRSRKNEMGPFKGGSLKLAVRSNALIVPITIDGSYKMREEHGGIITPAYVKLTIHPVIDASTLQDEDTKELANRLWKIINSALENRS